MVYLNTKLGAIVFINDDIYLFLKTYEENILLSHHCKPTISQKFELL